MITAKQAGLILGVSARAVYDLAASGRLPSYRPLPGAVRFDPADVETALRISMWIPSLPCIV